jgi:hypothetical protein
MAAGSPTLAITAPAAGKDYIGTVALPAVSLHEERVEVVEQDGVER